MKRFFLICLSAVMLSTFSCSKLSMLNNSVKMEKDAARDFENIFFEAIEKKDGELLKSCFSEAALKDAADIDKGIEYVLSAYKDGRATRTDDNISSYSQFKKGESFHTINAHCKFESGDNSYLVKWTQCLKNEADPSMEGVYSLEFFDMNEADDTNFYNIAGVAYPDREFLDDTLQTLFYYKGVKDDTTDIFSAELLEEADKYQLKCLTDFVDDTHNRSFNKMWVDNSSDRYIAYAYVSFSHTDYVLALKYDDDKKLMAVSAADDINGIDLRDYRITGVSEMMNK